ncbi:AsnC family transcriptional regulator [Nonomuraea sp. NPDC050786]|uniref:Lrp/AsnC family transcriptional regulator n=1 Tax=Nonomuraea sp. NPDC050786 TaxID=3154840 RepID=UPI0033C0E087
MAASILDELDRAIVHALHVDGRAPFNRIAKVLGVSDQTVARRYRRLRSDGLLTVVGQLEARRLGWVQWFVRRVWVDRSRELIEVVLQGDQQHRAAEGSAELHEDPVGRAGAGDVRAFDVTQRGGHRRGHHRPDSAAAEQQRGGEILIGSSSSSSTAGPRRAESRERPRSFISGR